MASPGTQDHGFNASMLFEPWPRRSKALSPIGPSAPQAFDFTVKWGLTMAALHHRSMAPFFASEA